MEKTLFIHVWMWQDDGQSMIREQVPVYSLEETIKQYHEENTEGVEYLHTLHVHYNTSNPAQSFAREMCILDFVTDKDESVKSEYEALTGHEMGVCKGRA